MNRRNKKRNDRIFKIFYICAFLEIICSICIVSFIYFWKDLLIDNYKFIFIPVLVISIIMIVAIIYGIKLMKKEIYEALEINNAIVKKRKTAHFVFNRKGKCESISKDFKDIFRSSPAYLKNQKLKDVITILFSGRSGERILEEINEWKGNSLRIPRSSYYIDNYYNIKYITILLEKTMDEKTILMINDETEIVEKELALEDSLNDIAFASDKKSLFLNQIGHDIRTPMNAISNFSTLIKENANDVNKVKEYAAKISISNSYLLSLINDILDIDKIESGKLVLNKERFNLQNLIDEDLNILNTEIKKKKQSLILFVDEFYQEYVGDKLRTSQILINILSNSIKYTPDKGTIFFSAKKISIGEKSDKIRFEVIDNGIGMSSELIKKIYEPYAREKTARIKKIKGMGLGMTIVKKLVDLMDGKITIESKEDLGSKISIDIEFFKASIEDYKKKNFENIRFLIAEDNKINIEIISSLLTLEKAQFDICNNGEEVVRKFTTSNNNYYDFILMDVEMPILNGYEATKLIRNSNHAQAATIPIIAMTANSSFEHMKKSNECGINYHVPKPINLENFKETIYNAKINK